MIHLLEIENFYSIRDKQVIDLRAAGNAPDEPDRLVPVWKGADEVAPKVVAFFGPNASGKSNVLRALSFIAWFVRDSFSVPPEGRLPFQRFNDTGSMEASTRLAIHLGGVEDIARIGDPDARQCRYEYELVIGGGLNHVVEAESLYFSPSRASRRVKLFARDSEGNVTAGKDFSLTGYRQALEKVLRPNVSVVATLAQLQHPYAMQLRAAATNVMSNILVEKGETSEDLIVRHYASSPKLVEALNSEIERVDFGIQALEFQQGPDGPIALLRHEGLTYPMPLTYESYGTRQFLKLYPIVLHTLETGGVAVLDELDAAIHPHMLVELLRWFHYRNRNPYNAQLWMSCHSVSLLDELIKEEVLFCEKDRRGRTQVYGLRDIKGVRRDGSYYKKYLGGVYGAVPQIG